MATVATLLLGIKADTSQLKRGLKSVNTSFRSMSKTVGIAKKAVAGFFAVQAGRKLAGLGADVVKTTDAIGKLSQRLGLSTEFLSEFRFAAERSGIAANTTDLALQRVTRRFGEIARTGRGTALPALKELGEDLVTAVRNGASFEDLLPKIADRLSKTENEAKRLSIAFQLFDSEGAKFVQLLGLGSDTIEQFRTRARKLGVTISQDMANSASSAADAVQDLTASWDAFVREVIVPLLPQLTSVIDKMGELANGVKALRDSGKDLRKGFFNFLGDQLSQGLKRGIDSLGTRQPQFQGRIPSREERRQGQFGAQTPGGSPGLDALSAGADQATERLQQAAVAMDELKAKQMEFAESANQAWENFRIKATDVISQVKFAALDLTQSFSRGFGQAIANVIVFGQDFGEAMKVLFRNLLAQVVATVTQMLVELVIANTIARAIGTAAHVSRVGQAAQLIYLNVFSSLAAIPIFGPAIAAASTLGIATAAVASGAAFGVASAATGAVQLADGGFIRADGLAMLHAGEVVATPQEVKSALSGGGQGMTVIQEIDGRQVSKTVTRYQPGIFRMQGIAR